MQLVWTSNLTDSRPTNLIFKSKLGELKAISNVKKSLTGRDVDAKCSWEKILEDSIKDNELLLEVRKYLFFNSRRTSFLWASGLCETQFTRLLKDREVSDGFRDYKKKIDL